MKKFVGILLAVMLLVLAVSALAEDPIIGGRKMYVYSLDGEPVRVRSSMSTADNSNVLGIDLCDEPGIKCLNAPIKNGKYAFYTRPMDSFIDTTILTSPYRRPAPASFPRRMPPQSRR